MDWKFIVGALIAIGGVYYAARTFRENRLSKRARLLPITSPGHMRLSSGLDGPSLEITLVNSGTNPAHEVAVELMGFNEADIDGRNQNPSPIGPAHFQSANPIPHDERLIMRLDRDSLSDIGVLITNYLVAEITYSDQLLNKRFTEYFYWRVDRTGELEDPNSQALARLKELLEIYLETRESNGE